MEPRPQLKTRIVGWVILITMLSLSFFFVPLVMRQMEFEVLPKEGVVIWLAMSAFVIAFPVMASHLYVMAVRKYMKWLSYWFVVAVATLGLMILYRLTLSEKVYGYHIAQGMFFVSCFVGGTFGGMVVLSLIRRFAPRWLSVNLANGASQVDHRYGLKTIFVWTAAIAVIAAALTNPENVLLEERLTHNIYLGQLTGAICVGLFCALVLLPTLSWLTTVRPFWFGKLSLLVCSVVFPMTICGVFSKLTMGGSSELPLVAVYLSSVLFWLSVYAILWSTGCHWAGLIEEVPPKGKRTNVLRHIDTMSSALGRGSRYFIFATTVLSVLFALVWGVIHFAGGDERNIELINDEIHQLLDNNDTDRDWIEVINDQRSAGITAENNVAMKVLRVFNPYPVRLFQFDKRFPPKLTLISNDSEIGQQDELKRLGLTYEYLQELPTLNVRNWFYQRAEGAQKQLRESYLAMPKKASQQTQTLSRGQKLDELFTIAGIYTSGLKVADWTAEDFSLVAELVSSHQTQIAELIELSKQTDYYAPLVRKYDGKIAPREFERKLFRTPFSLLNLAGFYHISRNEIEAAIVNCESIWRFIKLANAGADTRCLKDPALVSVDSLALAIVFSGSATESQMRRVLKSWSMVEDDDESFSQMKKLNMIMKYDQAYRWMKAFDGKDGRYDYNDPPFRKLYKRYPRLVNWRQFADVFGQLNEDAWENYQTMAKGELNHADFWSKSWEIFDKKFPNGRKVRGDRYNRVLDRQLSVLVSGPKAKGRLLAESLAAGESYTDARLIWNVRREVGKIQIALEIFKAKHSVYPKQLQDLVPDILPAISKDPITLANFVYVPSQDDFKLYSIGKNMTDDGGDSIADVVFPSPLKSIVEYIESLKEIGGS